MGASQCCSKVLQDERNSELVIKGEDTEKSSGKLKQSLEQRVSVISRSPLPKQKPTKQNNDEPATPGFADLKSSHSRKSEQSNKEILLVGEIQHAGVDKQEKDSPIVSQRSLTQKRKNDSPVTIFEMKNSLKNFDTSKLQKLRSQQDLNEGQSRVEEIPEKDNESQRSQSLDNKSVKSILKHELKYSQFRKTKTNHDMDSRKVRFQFE